MTQRKKSAHNNSQSAWQRSLPAQSLCWLGSFSLLSSGFVVAQPTSGIDNIVPTAKSSQARNNRKVTKNAPIIISGAPAPESPKQAAEFSQRRSRLRQRLSVNKNSNSGQKKPATRKKVNQHRKGATTLKTRLRRSRTGSVVIKHKKQAPAPRPRVVIKKKPTQLKPTAPKVRIASPKKPRTILPRTTTVNKPKRDYNNAAIDPTNYGKKYQAPNSVVITGRKSGCQSVANGQGISGNCAASGSRINSKKAPIAKKTTPSWLRASQNANTGKVTPSRTVAQKTKKTIAPPQKVSSREVTRTVLPGKSANTYRATKTIKRVASATPNAVRNAVKSVTKVTPNPIRNTNSRSVGRVAPGSFT